MGLGQEQCCTICCSEYVEGEIITELPCRHLFHKPCVTLWLQRVSTTGLVEDLEGRGECILCLHRGGTTFNSLKMWDEIPRDNWLLNLCIMEPNSSASEERNLYLYSSEGQFL